MVGTTENKSASDAVEKQHPMAVLLWILGAANFIAGAIVSARSKEIFGICRYEYTGCDNPSDYRSTLMSEIASYAWAIGLNNLLLLGTLAVLIGLLHKISLNTTR